MRELLLLAIVPLAVGCMTDPSEPTVETGSATTPTAHNGSASPPPTGEGSGFGTDLIFDDLLATPNLVSRAACAGLGLAAGDQVQLFAQEDSFTIERADATVALQIRVPSQGDYVWQGQRPDRTTDELDASAPVLRATMNPDTADVTVELAGDTCVLARCPAFGTCE